MPDKKQLLLVDDDVTFSEVMARAFTQKGFATSAAHTVDDALANAQAKPPSHIVLDLNMPGGSGLSAIPGLLKASPKARIVVLTGYSSIATTVEAIKLGATNYLCKPATVSEILTAFDGEANSQAAEIELKLPSVERLEWEHIQKALHKNQGNVSATARELGMHRRTLQRKLQKKPVKK